MYDLCEQMKSEKDIEVFLIILEKMFVISYINFALKL